jgi:hypothetical protein
MESTTLQLKLQVQPLVPDMDIQCHLIDEEENVFAADAQGGEKSCKRARFSMSDAELHDLQPAPRIVKRRFSFDLNVRRSFTPAPPPIASAPVVVVPLRGISPAPTVQTTTTTTVARLPRGFDDVRVGMRFVGVVCSG